MKRKIAMLLACIMVLSCAALLSGCGGDDASTDTTTGTTDTTGGDTSAPAEKITLKWGSPNSPEASSMKCCLYFFEVLEELMPGYWDIQIFDSGSVGGERDLMNAVLMNNLQGCISSDGGIAQVDTFPECDLGNVPFLITNHDKYFELIDNGLFDYVHDAYAERGLELCAMYVVSQNVLGNTKRDVILPEDAKGLKLRIWEAEGPKKFLNAIGAGIIVMSLTEVYTALQQGAVDGAITSDFQFNDNKWNEVGMHITDDGVMTNYFVMMFNKEWFDSLPAEAQEGLKEAGRISYEWDRDEASESFMALTREKYEEYGVELYKPTAETHQAWVDISVPLWTDWRDIIGAELFDMTVEIMGHDWTPAA